MPTPITGGCLCGRVRYQVQGPVSHASHCHCTMCQKATGGVAGSSFNVARSGITWTQQPARYASSPGVQRGFCATCGSPLSYESEKAADRIALTIGSLDDPSRISPDKHIYAETRIPWLTLDPDLPGWE